MAADITPRDFGAPVSRAPRAYAFLSSVLVTVGALMAAAVMMVAALVSLPIMLAASATIEPGKRPSRRGWQELEAPSA